MNMKRRCEGVSFFLDLQKNFKQGDLKGNFYTFNFRPEAALRES